MEAKRAILEPLSNADVSIDTDALELIINETKGYPYFIQEWGYQTWNNAKKSPITKNDVLKSNRSAIARLDQNFFHSRYERLTEIQKVYLRVMAELGPGPHRSGDIAKLLGKTTSQLGTTREGLIKNGMIYSPRYGQTAFTVPLFDEFMKRVQPSFP